MSQSDLAQTFADFEIFQLSDMPDLAERCAAFHAVQTGDSSDEGLDMRKAAFRRLALDGETEDALICVKAEGAAQGMLAGLCVLVEKELEAFEEFGPWLSSLVIAPEFQNTGLDRYLIEKGQGLARQFGQSELFVQTAQPVLYTMLGFATIEPFEKSDKSYFVMCKML